LIDHLTLPTVEALAEHLANKAGRLSSIQRLWSHAVFDQRGVHAFS
jgi:hypothetical protein